MAGFSVWGRPDKASRFTLLPSIFDKHGFKCDWEYLRNFHLGDEKHFWRELLKAGFSSVKTFYV